MLKKLATLMLVLCGLSAFGQSHTLPTLDRTNNWTGVNTFVPGNLRLGSTNLTCAGSQVMTGFTFQFNPICGSALTGVASLNGLTGAVTLAAGTNISFTTSGNTLTIAASGGGGGGSLNTLPNDELTNTVGNTAQDMFNFISNATYTPQTAVNDAVTNHGMATLLPTSSGVFTNNSNIKVQDYEHLGAMYRSLTEWGAQCDSRQVNVNITVTSTTVSINNDFFHHADVGKVIVLTGSVGGVPTAFETVISALISPSGDNAASATMTTAAPFGGSFLGGVLGHDDTASIQKALDTGAGMTIPVGMCLTHTLTYKDNSLLGLDGNASSLAGMPGETIIQQIDPSQAASAAGYGVRISNFTAFVHNAIDATQAWQIINDSGTTSKTSLYQPTGILTAASNNPLAPGWFQGSGTNFSGAINGVGAISSGSPTLMTVPAGARLPTNSQKIVFPYLTTVFTTTVASVNTGTRVVTLNAAYPGSTASQIEWFAGTSPQTIAANVSGGSCPSSITVTNPITASPVTESNVAPVGLIQIDGEQFTYRGKSNAATPNAPYFLTITGCAQNGTTRTAHTSGATVVPLNQFKPTTPWPVTPTINAGATTPTLAAFYPAWNVGNGFWEAPVANGATGVFGVGSFANATVSNLHIDAYPTTDAVNNTVGFYLVSLPYSTSFRDIDMTAYYGIAEGVPAFNSGAGWAAAQPTADGTRWEAIRINACNDMSIIAGNQNTYKDFNVYSQCEQTIGTTVGANTAWYFSYSWNDETGGILSAAAKNHMINLYAEPETGPQYGLYPVYQMDCFDCIWDDMHMGGGGENIVGGTNQHWRGGNFNNTAFFPTINYGSGNSADYGTLLVTSPALSNTYGSSGLIDYGNNSNWLGLTGNSGQTGPFGPNSIGVGNNRQPIPSQTNETFNTGNINSMYTSSDGGFIPASEFNSSFSFESQAMNVPWHYDSSLLPDGSIAGGAVGCFLSGTSTNNCFSFLFNQRGIPVGPMQRIVAGKYTMYVASKSTGAATSYSLSLGVCSPGSVGAYSIPVTSTYSVTSVQVDLTTQGTCSGGIGLGFGFSNAADTLSVAYVDFAPVGVQPTDNNINILNQIKLNGSTGTSGQCIVSGGSGSPDVWGTCSGGGGGGGSVTSVGITAPTWLTVTNSPITTAGNIAIASAVEAPNLVLASPTSGSGALAPRALVVNDIPTGLPYLTGLSGDVVATGTGVVASTVNRIGGGTLLSTFTGLLQNNAGTVVQATTFSLTGSGQVGTRYTDGVNVVTFSATPVFDLSLGDTQMITLTADVTSSTFTNAPAAGFSQVARFIICQDGTGNHKFVWPTSIQGVTPVTQIASQCTSEFFNVTNSLAIADNYNTENCISSASPAVCDQATIGEIAIPTGTNPTLQINTTAWTAHSQLIFSPDSTKGADLSVTCNTNVPPAYMITSAVANTSVTLTFYGTISTNPLCGTFSIRNP